MNFLPAIDKYSERCRQVCGYEELVRFEISPMVFDPGLVSSFRATYSGGDPSEHSDISLRPWR